MQNYKISPKQMASSLWCNRELITVLVKREIVARYRGSVLGTFWSLLNPILLLSVYTFVFSVVFKTRWHMGSDSKTEFALVLFAGLMAFNLFSECFTRAPSLILSNVNYVKKVVFPLEILPWVALGSALFHTCISLGVWLGFYFVFFGPPPVTALLLPVVFLPLTLLTVGVSWFLAALGVYLRDVSQFVTLSNTVLMFLSPIFYPINALPPEYQHLLLINPLTYIVEKTRDVLIWGNLPTAESFIPYLAASSAICWLGFAWFQKTRRGFADVI